MTDGPSLQIVPPQTNRETLTIIERTEPDLYNFAAWIEYQSPATMAAILELAANELYRRQDWPGIAGRLKDVVRDLRAAAREDALPDNATMKKRP